MMRHVAESVHTIWIAFAMQEYKFPVGTFPNSQQNPRSIPALRKYLKAWKERQDATQGS